MDEIKKNMKQVKADEAKIKALQADIRSAKAGNFRIMKVGTRSLEKILDIINRQKAEIERLNKCVMSEEQVRECCVGIIQVTREQAVKDTVEEIINVLDCFNRFGNNTYAIKLIKTRYGIEVGL